jgi:transcriptional regulator with XRE-family HTH domain
MGRLAELRQSRGWSQRKLYAELERQARLEGSQIASWASMKTRISKWENGHVVPDEFNRRLLAAVFGVDEDALGYTESAGPVLAPPDSSMVPALAVSADVVTFLEGMFSKYAEADRLLGPRAVLGVVREQCRMVENLCSSAREPIRSELLRVGAQYFELGGWLAQDSGDLDAAASWSARALDMAYEAGNAWLTSYIFMRRSNIATDAGNRAEGLGLARAALREGAQLGPKLRALVLRQQAVASALNGDEHGCARAVDGALEAVTETGEPEPQADYCTTPYIQMEGAAAWTKLGRPDRAVGLLADALAGWPASDQRDRGIGLARLATAHALGGTPDAASTVAREALTVIQAAPSARAIAELTRLRMRLAPWRSVREVAEVTDLLRSIA